VTKKTPRKPPKNKSFTKTRRRTNSQASSSFLPSQFFLLLLPAPSSASSCWYIAPSSLSSLSSLFRAHGKRQRRTFLFYDRAAWAPKHLPPQKRQTPSLSLPTHTPSSFFFHCFHWRGVRLTTWDAQWTAPYMEVTGPKSMTCTSPRNAGFLTIDRAVPACTEMILELPRLSTLQP
jgi:hypothetical protein